MTPPRISVAMCTYNGARFVEQQLRSILAQDLRPDEIVVADDGSTDGTTPVVERTLADAAPSMTVTLLPPDARPLGVSANFERALRATTGDLVLLADQDDIWAPARISATVPVFNDDSVLVHAWDARLVDDQGRDLGRSQLDAMSASESERRLLNSPQAYEALIRRNVLPGMTFAVRQSFLQQVLPIPHPWPHDYFLAFMAGAHGGLRVSTRSDLLRYRQHSDNVVGSRGVGLVAGVRRARAAADDVEHRAELFASMVRLLEARADTPSAVLETARAKLAFESSRLAMPRRLPGRTKAALSKAADGSYTRFASAGRLTAAQDVLWPARPRHSTEGSP